MFNSKEMPEDRPVVCEFRSDENYGEVFMVDAVGLVMALSKTMIEYKEMRPEHSEGMAIALAFLTSGLIQLARDADAMETFQKQLDLL